MLLAKAFELFVFDFDGTLVDSDGAKSGALRKFALKWNPSMVLPLQLDLVSSMTRFELVRSVRAGLRETKRSANISEELLLSEISFDIESAVLGCEQFENSGNILSRLRELAPIYLVSKTPEAELIRHVRKFGWDGLFEGIFGGPTRKEAYLKELRKDRSPSSKTLHIGNTIDDLMASVDSGYWHLNVMSDHKPIETEYEYFLANIKNLSELEKFLFSRNQMI